MTVRAVPELAEYCIRQSAERDAGDSLTLAADVDTAKSAQEVGDCRSFEPLLPFCS